MLDRRPHVEELVESTRVLRRAVSALAASEDARITASQWLVIGHVFRNEGCTVNEAASALGMSGSAVTQLVNGLVAKGYVVRRKSLEDKRAHRLSLSAASKKRIMRFRRKRVELLLGMFRTLNDGEFRHYLALNKKLISALAKKSL